MLTHIRFIVVTSLMLTVVAGLHIEQCRLYSAAQELRAKEKLQVDRPQGFMPREADQKKPLP
jgi:hypothetical protein